MYIIYQHINKINGKSYVGLTKRCMRARWYGHVCEAKRGHRTHFHAALQKYGPDDWDSRELCCCKTAEDAEILEQHFIREFDSYRNGYNMTEGGNAFRGLCGPANGMYGKTHTDDVKRKLSNEATKRFRDKSYEELYGKEKAAELRQKRRESTRRTRRQTDYTGPNNPNAKRVIIKDIEFATSADAAKHFNRSRPTISEWLRTRKDCYFV